MPPRCFMTAQVDAVGHLVHLMLGMHVPFSIVVSALNDSASSQQQDQHYVVQIDMYSLPEPPIRKDKVYLAISMHPFQGAS